MPQNPPGFVHNHGILFFAEDTTAAATTLRGSALRSREAQYKAGAGPFCQLLATIPLQKAQLETERIPKKRSLFAAQVALFIR